MNRFRTLDMEALAVKLRMIAKDENSYEANRKR